MLDKILTKIREVNISWIWLCILAVVFGIYSGLIVQVEVLENTTVRDLFTAPEWWVFFGMLIATSQSSFIKAGLKSGVFFVIYMSVKYLTMWPFSGNFNVELWIKAMIFAVVTFVLGGCLWNCTRRDKMGDAIISVPLSGLFISGCIYTYSAIFSFPYHLVSAVLTFVQLGFWLIVIVQDKKNIIKTLIYLIIVTLILTGGWLIIVNLPAYGI